MTSRQTSFIVALQSIGADICEAVDNPSAVDLKKTLLNYRELKTHLEFYFENRTNEI